MSPKLRLLFCAFLAASCSTGSRTGKTTTFADILNSVQPKSKLRDKQEKCRELERKPISFEEEKAFGGAVAVQLVRRGGGLRIDRPALTPDELSGKTETLHLPSSEDNELGRLINRVGMNLAMRSTRPEIPWTFAVLKSEVVNAVSAPGGYVFVTTGLLRKLTNEAQLAGVLAHEIIHVTERHALYVYSHIKSEQCQLPVKLQAAAVVVGGAVGAPDLLTLVFAQALDDPKNVEALRALTDGYVDTFLASGYGPNQEFEADWRALELVIAAGYAPAPYIDFVGTLSKGGGAFDHHPDTKERQARLRRWLDIQKPSGSSFANVDWPYDSYPKVPFDRPLVAGKATK
ncbi:MAG: M48 family metalloprotease [Myxococcota bacterium]